MGQTPGAIFRARELEANPQGYEADRAGPARRGDHQRSQLPGVAAFDSTDERAFFTQTGHSAGGWFLQHWRDHGGVNLFGYPISEELVENGRTVQYFERARFELAPGGTDPNSGIALGQIGREALVKLGWLAPDQAPSR